MRMIGPDRRHCHQYQLGTRNWFLILPVLTILLVQFGDFEGILAFFDDVVIGFIPSRDGS